MYGITAAIEDWLAEQLTALEYNDKLVFKTAQPWKYQIESGTESFGRFEPFAFVSYWPSNSSREGGYDLNDKLRFSVLIGLTSKEAGVARRGDDNNLGASQIRDLVIELLDNSHPGDGFECDNLFYSDETEMVDAPKKYVTELHFVCNRMRS